MLTWHSKRTFHHAISFHQCAFSSFFFSQSKSQSQILLKKRKTWKKSKSIKLKKLYKVPVFFQVFILFTAVDEITFVWSWSWSPSSEAVGGWSFQKENFLHKKNFLNSNFWLHNNFSWVIFPNSTFAMVWFPDFLFCPELYSHLVWLQAVI